MTALAGHWAFGAKSDPTVDCRTQLDAQRTLGTDPAYWKSEQLALGRTITRFLQEDRYDDGPVVLANGAYALVADIRLDNRSELGRALGIAAESLKTQSDASVLMQCWLAWGPSALSKMVGDFCFAIWDRDSQALMLATDFMGQRPLHYAIGDGFFAFASMPRGLHALDRVTATPAMDAALRFTQDQRPRPGMTFFEGISQVPPGHMVTVRKDDVRSRKWWSFQTSHDQPMSPEIIEEARSLLDSSVAVRLRGTPGVTSSHLSGGLDSSGVTATAARLLQASGGKLISFTAAPQVSNVEAPRGTFADERELAQAVARRFPNIEHICTSWEGSLMDVFERDCTLWERPVPNPFNDLWWSGISKLAASKGARILLTAPMGNISLSMSGTELIAQLAAGMQISSLARLLFDARRQGAASWNALVRMTLQQMLPPSSVRLIRRLRGQSGPNPFLTQYARHRAKRCVDPGEGRSSFLERRLDVISMTNPGNFNSGGVAGWGIEMRDPLADRNLVEFTLKLPPQAFFEEGRPRSLARKVLADRLPKAVIDEYRKGYQSADWYLTLIQDRDRLIAEADAIAVSAASEIIDGPALRRALIGLPKSGRADHTIWRRYGADLVCALQIGHFIRTNGAGSRSS